MTNGEPALTEAYFRLKELGIGLAQKYTKKFS